MSVTVTKDLITRYIEP